MIKRAILGVAVLAMVGGAMTFSLPAGANGCYLCRSGGYVRYAGRDTSRKRRRARRCGCRVVGTTTVCRNPMCVVWVRQGGEVVATRAARCTIEPGVNAPAAAPSQADLPAAPSRASDDGTAGPAPVAHAAPLVNRPNEEAGDQEAGDREAADRQTDEDQATNRDGAAEDDAADDAADRGSEDTEPQPVARRQRTRDDRARPGRQRR